MRHVATYRPVIREHPYPPSDPSGTSASAAGAIYGGPGRTLRPQAFTWPPRPWRCPRTYAYTARPSNSQMAAEAATDAVLLL